MEFSVGWAHTKTDGPRFPAGLAILIGIGDQLRFQRERNYIQTCNHINQNRMCVWMDGCLEVMFCSK